MDRRRFSPDEEVVFLLAPWFRRLAGRIGQRPIPIPGGVISAAAALSLFSRADSAPAYHRRLAWSLVAVAGVAVSVTSWWLPRTVSATRAGEYGGWIDVPQPRRATSLKGVTP